MIDMWKQYMNSSFAIFWIKIHQRENIPTIGLYQLLWRIGINEQRNYLTLTKYDIWVTAVFGTESADWCKFAPNLPLMVKSFTRCNRWVFKVLLFKIHLKSTVHTVLHCVLQISDKTFLLQNQMCLNKYNGVEFVKGHSNSHKSVTAREKGYSLYCNGKMECSLQKRQQIFLFIHKFHSFDDY